MDPLPLDAEPAVARNNRRSLREVLREHPWETLAIVVAAAAASIIAAGAVSYIIPGGPINTVGSIAMMAAGSGAIALTLVALGIKQLYEKNKTQSLAEIVVDFEEDEAADTEDARNARQAVYQAQVKALDQAWKDEADASPKGQITVFSKGEGAKFLAANFGELEDGKKDIRWEINIPRGEYADAMDKLYQELQKANCAPSTKYYSP